jgi:hypothetical protein
MPGRSLLRSRRRMPLIGISVGVLNRRTIRGLSGEPKNVPPAEVFSPLEYTATCSHSLNVTDFVGAFFLNDQAAVGGDRPDIDVIEVGAGAGFEQAAEDGARDRIGGGKFAGLAAVGDVDAVELLRRQLPEQSAELLAQHQVGPQMGVGLRVEGRQIHGVAHLALRAGKAVIASATSIPTFS